MNIASRAGRHRITRRRRCARHPSSPPAPPTRIRALPVATHVVTAGAGIARELHDEVRGTDGAARSRMRTLLLSALLVVPLVGCVTDSSEPRFGGADDFGGG